MYLVRRANAGDAASLQAMFRVCRAAAHWLPDEARFQADFAKESVDETVLVAVDSQGHVVGVVSVFEAEAFVHHLYVRSELHRQGIGKALLQGLQAVVPFPWRLKCPPGNTAALKFYAAQGWWEVARGESSWGEYLLLECSGPLPGKNKT